MKKLLISFERGWNILLTLTFFWRVNLFIHLYSSDFNLWKLLFFKTKRRDKPTDNKSLNIFYVRLPHKLKKILEESFKYLFNLILLRLGFLKTRWLENNLLHKGIVNLLSQTILSKRSPTSRHTLGMSLTGERCQKDSIFTIMMQSSKYQKNNATVL